MNQSEPSISNKYFVDESIINGYIQKKNEFMKEREKKAWQGIIFTIIITFLYYLDIGTDLYLCWKYYINGDIGWFGITLGIVILSSLLNTFILFYYSYLQEFKFNWKKKQCPRIIIKSFCL
jgi:hypothetical protein